MERMDANERERREIFPAPKNELANLVDNPEKVNRNQASHHHLIAEYLNAPKANMLAIAYLKS